MNRIFTPDDTWRPRHCPGCGANAARPRFTKENVPYVECYGCGTVYVNPVPPDAVFDRLYNEDWAAYFQDVEKLERDFDPARYWRECDAIPRDRRHGALLDVGCATGSFLALAKANGFHPVSGIDVSAPSVAYANDRLGEPAALAGSFLDQPFAPATFDVVTLWATLEHLPNAEAFVREAHRVLRPDGLLCVSVPNRGSVAMRALGPKYHMVGLEHVNYFSVRGLRALLGQCGFDVARSMTRGFNPFAFARDFSGRHLYPDWNARALLQEGAQNASMRQNPAVRLAERVVDRAVRAVGVGELLIMTGRKRRTATGPADGLAPAEMPIA